jgi:hypothetical protein
MGEVVHVADPDHHGFTFCGRRWGPLHRTTAIGRVEEVTCIGCLEIMAGRAEQMLGAVTRVLSWRPGGGER